MSGGALRLAGLTRVHGRGHVPALADLDLEVPAGSCVAILGPSGSGKSTVLRLTAGLDEPTAGSVHLDGMDLAGVAPERRGMAMVFQRPLLFPHLSVRDNVAFADRVRGVPRRAARRRADDFLELVQLGGYGGRPARALSGGQQQRVALARALAAEPRVLLLDEAFSALDASLREEMHELLADLRMRLDPTILLVTHDHAEADALADTVAVLDAGRLLQTGTMRDLYARPASLAVSRLLGGRTEVSGVVVDGRHRSPLGALDLPTRFADGPAVLVLRHEAVTTCSPADGDVRGTVVRVRGRGLRSLVTVEVTGNGGTAGGDGGRDGEDGGTVTGDGEVASVDGGVTSMHGGVASVDAELDRGHDVPTGRTVGLRIPLADRWVVPTDGESDATATSRTAAEPTPREPAHTDP